MNFDSTLLPDTYPTFTYSLAANSSRQLLWGTMNSNCGCGSSVFELPLDQSALKQDARTMKSSKKETLLELQVHTRPHHISRNSNPALGLELIHHHSIDLQQVSEGDIFCSREKFSKTYLMRDEMTLAARKRERDNVSARIFLHLIITRGQVLGRAMDFL